MSAEAIKSLLSEGLRWLSEGLRWPTRIVMKQLFSISSSPTIRLLLFWGIASCLVFAIACLLFHPILRRISRAPLLKYLGMKYGDMKLSLWRLKLTITDIELLPSRSSILRSVILAIFPSAHVQSIENCIEYPESKISVRKLSIKFRISSLAGPIQDTHQSISDADDEDKPAKNESKRGLRNVLYHLIPCPIIVVKLSGVSIEIEKAYLAPEPPSQFRTASLTNIQKLPVALPPPGEIEKLPSFCQDSLLEMKNEEVNEADNVTLLVQRWIDHAVTKTKKKSEMSISFVKSFSSSNGSKRNQLDPVVVSEGSNDDLTNCGEASAEQQTHEEKMNSWILWVTETVLHLITFELQQVSVMISGAGSEIVKEARKSYSPSEANLVFARLPRHRRALTVVGADAISLSFSPDEQCNALFCFVGLHTKVGNPIIANQADEDAFTQKSAANVPYAWHMLAHPFHLEAEVKGVMPFLIWAVNYDPYWQTKSLGLNLSTTEVAVSLSPDHLHTVLLHFDDYADTMSSFNEWLQWLKNTHCQTLETSEDEKVAYCNNYAQRRGSGAEEANKLDKEKQLTLSQMRDIERRMTRYEIMSLRCFAMKDLWTIPNGNKDFEEFLRSSRSSICDNGVESRVTSYDAPTPFQRLYPTPLHALVTLIRENSSVLTPHVTVKYFAQTLRIDFPGSREKSSMPSIPSSITVSGVSFDIDQMNPLLLDAGSSVKLDDPRPFLELSLQVCGCKWDVLDNMATSFEQELPFFRDGSLVGIVYMSKETVSSSNHVLSLGVSIAVTPTLEPEQQFGLTFSTSGLVIVVNSFPILSALRNLIELSDLPFQSPDEVLLDRNEYTNYNHVASDACVTPLGIKANITVSVKNTRLLFLVDLKRVNRGILNLHVHGINMEFESGGLSGKLSFLTKPISLCAGRILWDQSSHGGQIGFRLMPFLPIVDVNGVQLKILGKEDKTPTKATSNISNPEATTTLRLDIAFHCDSLLSNASPSTIVALLGVISSLDPFMDWAQGEQNAGEEDLRGLEDQGEKEEEQHLAFQYEVLRKIFKEIDVDGSGELSEDELELVVLKLFDKKNFDDGENQKINCASEPTANELKRERDYLLSIIDDNRTNEITLQELDYAIFRLANKIDDINLIPSVRDYSDRIYNSHLENADSFLSGPMLKKLVYFEDLREYSSLSEVYRITGQVGLESSSNFPAPSLWRKGEGIERFWTLYSTETGCTHHSLNGQKMSSVQRKLVRSLCNYEFAKFCWKTLVQPELYDEGTVVTHWLLDKDSRSRTQYGVVDLLLRHVETEVTKGINNRKGNRTLYFDAYVVARVDSAIVKFGSSHTFTNPLFEARFSHVDIKSSGLLSSQTGWFVPENELTNLEDDGKLENRNGNQVRFHSSISAFYLNTKHNHMECFIEPYNSDGSVTYRFFPAGDGDCDIYTEAASFSVHLNCPRFLNMNTSRCFFETASVLTKVISQSDPKTFLKMIFDRDVSYICNFWEAKDQSKSGFLSRDETLEVAHSVIGVHWNNEVAGLSENEKHRFVAMFCKLAIQGEEGNDIISLENLILAFKTYKVRCYFSGSEDILIKNKTGRELKASTHDDLEEHCRQHSIMSEVDYQQLLDTFYSIDDGNPRAVPLPLSGRLAFTTPGYKIVDDISVSPYQSIMLPLKHRKKGSHRKRRYSSASGFRSHLTVVSKSDSLDQITLEIRTSVHICSEIPIKIRIVRLGKSAVKFRKRTKKIDLGTKNLIGVLRRAAEGASIVYTKSGIKEGVVASLPLDVLDSSHYHVLLIQPLTGHNNTPCSAWRDPILITKDFLFNSMNMREVSRCHTLSGIVVQKERLNVHLSNKHRNTPIAGDTKRSILRRTAWDTTIQIVPFFLLSNSLPFPIVVRTWQTAEEDKDLLWDDVLLPVASIDGINEYPSSDEDFSFATPSIKGRRTSPDDIHLSSAGNVDHYSQDNVAISQTLRLSGVSLRHTLFIQVSQHVNASEEVKFMWTDPLQIHLKRMRTGVNKKGLTQLPKLTLDLGDNCDCLVHVSIGCGTRVPECTIYCPYWIMNKTGLKLEYKVSGQNKSYLDSGTGGLPIMIHGSKSEQTNAKYQNASKEISVIPLECLSQDVARNWWDETSNGLLVLRKGAMGWNGQTLVDWSENIALDKAGTSGEIECGRFIINARTDSLAGAFHRSNLISFTPRYVVKNMLHIEISILPLFGGVHDAIRKASQLRQNMKEEDLKRKLDLASGESTILFNFHNSSSGNQTPCHWIAFCVNASRYGASFKRKWHLIPVDVIESHFLGEHDGSDDIMCGILEAKVHSSYAGSMLVSISHAEVPPFRIENRSSTHYLRFVQNDNEAVVFELPPMYSCAYTWDSPLGKKKLRAVVIPKAKSKENQLEEALKLERYDETLQDNDTDTTDSNDESIGIKTSKEPLLHSLNKDVRPDSRARELNKTERYRSPRKRAVFTLGSRSYRMSKVGKQKDLPCPSAKESESSLNTMSSKLFTHTRIERGTKIFSFSDSSRFADQVQAGITRKGGNFKSALCEINLEGFGLYIMDDFPREVMAVVVRDIQILKPTGSIKLTTRIRHFQVDAMLPSARYPIIIEPILLGVDRRDPMIQESDSSNLIVPESVAKRDCFWMQNEEKPIPVLEIACSYVPQVNMIWVPSLNISIRPLKLHIDVDYILRILGMVVNSIFKYQADVGRNLAATSHANDQLQYITRGQLNVCMTYIEKLYIAPVYFEMELNLKSDDPDHDDEVDSSWTLHSIAQTTNSGGAAGLLSWVINVGANFAHVSPRFSYSQQTYTDQYCDIFDLLAEIMKSYIVQTIKQALKVVFSMQLLGNPRHFTHQLKTGVSDLFIKSRDEIAAGGKDGVGKGVASLIQNVGGGTAFFVGKMFGGVADTLDSLATSSELTSNHLKPKSASSDGENMDNAIDGVVEGVNFFSQTVVHGIAGLIGNPYRGAKTGTVTGAAKGVVSGLAGFVTAPLIGAFGFIAKASDGIGATTKYLELGVIETRCRPVRMVPWGRPMCENGLAYLKAIGIRVHTVSYQKTRKRIIQKDDIDNGDGNVNSKEFKIIRAAEERRKHRPRKSLSIMHEKDKYHHITAPIRPKLLSDEPGNLILSHYMVTFEETIILRSTNLQLSDVVAINVWNYHGLKSATTRAKPLGVCKISVGDIYSSVLHFYKEQLKQKESYHPTKNSNTDSLIIPIPQECALFKPCKKQKLNQKDIFDVIDEELAAIEKSEEDKFVLFDSDSSESDSDDSSFLGGGAKKAKEEEDPASVVKANERLFGSVSLSFFPIPW